MLSNVLPGPQKSFSQIESWAREQAANRFGVKQPSQAYCVAWSEARHYEDCSWSDVVLDALGMPIVDEFTVCFSAEEWKMLCLALLPKIEAGNLSSQALQSGTSYVLNSIFPGASRDAVAMQQCGLHAFLRWATHCPSRIKGFCCAEVKPTYCKLYNYGVGDDTTTATIGDNGGSGEQGEGVTDGKGDSKAEPPGTDGQPAGTDEDRAQLAQEGAAPIHSTPDVVGGVDRRDCKRQDLGGEYGDKHAVILGNTLAIRAQVWDKGQTKASDEVLGVVLGATTKPPIVYSTRPENLEAAKVERIDKKQRVPKSLDPEFKATVEELIGYATGRTCNTKQHHDLYGVWSPNKIREWAKEIVGVEDCISKKWAKIRAHNGIKQLYDAIDPKIKDKAAIKAEPMPDGKPPRLLIATGDEGQLMAAVVVKCFEDLMFKHLKGDSIKGKDPGEAGDYVASKHRPRDDKGAEIRVTTLEGDGSAWDTTCTLPVRECVENPIYEHIVCELERLNIVPPSWNEAFLESVSVEKQKPRSVGAYLTPAWYAIIHSIRRSGERQTSGGNFWLNWCQWVCTVFPKGVAYKFLNPEKRSGKDRDGITRMLLKTIEGDDSLLSTAPPVDKGSKTANLWEKSWADRGYNMKIIYAEKRATFVGRWFAVDSHGTKPFWSPEIPRALTNWSISCSTEAKRIVDLEKQGKAAEAATALSNLRYAIGMSRANDFAGRFNTLAKKFYEFATTHGKMIADEDSLSHEFKMRTTGEKSQSVRNIVDRIEEKLAKKTDDLRLLRELQLPTTKRELVKFAEAEWPSEAGDLIKWKGNAFMQSLPPSWVGG